MDAVKVSRRLRELRQNYGGGKGISFEKLEKALREKYNCTISAQALKNYERAAINGECENITKGNAVIGMRIEYLAIFADFYGVSTEYLLGLSDVPSANQNVRDVCEYTGLSHKTVERLHVLHAVMESDMFARVIDFLVTDTALKQEKHDYNSLLWLLNFYLKLDASGNEKAYTMDSGGKIRPFRGGGIPSSRIAFDGILADSVALTAINQKLAALKQAKGDGNDGKH